MNRDNGTEEVGSRVLVIDDEEVVHASLRKILSRLGFSVEGVLSAREGLAKLDAGRFDLVITDLMMPQMNGIELLEELRRRRCQTPVLLITGYPTIRTAVHAMRLGAVDYVAKPFTRRELLSPVRRALRLEGDEPVEWQHPEALTVDALQPGMVVCLPHHAWAQYEQDGTFLIGVEPSFLRAAGEVTTVTPADDVEMIEQGFVGLVLSNAQGEDHAVAMPLSGQVVAVHTEAFADRSRIDADTWLLRVLPSRLADELPLLVPRG